MLATQEDLSERIFTFWDDRSRAAFDQAERQAEGELSDDCAALLFSVVLVFAVFPRPDEQLRRLKSEGIVEDASSHFASMFAVEQDDTYTASDALEEEFEDCFLDGYDLFTKFLEVKSLHLAFGKWMKDNPSGQVLARQDSAVMAAALAGAADALKFSTETWQA